MGLTRVLEILQQGLLALLVVLLHLDLHILEVLLNFQHLVFLCFNLTCPLFQHPVVLFLEFRSVFFLRLEHMSKSSGVDLISGDQLLK
jgi:hypothetical protein